MDSNLLSLFNTSTIAVNNPLHVFNKFILCFIILVGYLEHNDIITLYDQIYVLKSYCHKLNRIALFIYLFILFYLHIQQRNRQ